jgi:hypothetical protein
MFERIETKHYRRRVAGVDAVCTATNVYSRKGRKLLSHKVVCVNPRTGEKLVHDFVSHQLRGARRRRRRRR